MNTGSSGCLVNKEIAAYNSVLANVNLPYFSGKFHMLCHKSR